MFQRDFGMCSSKRLIQLHAVGRNAVQVAGIGESGTQDPVLPDFSVPGSIYVLVVVHKPVSERVSRIIQVLLDTGQV